MAKKDEKNFIDEAKKTVNKIMNTEDQTKKFTKKDIQDNKAMAILSYIIAPIPYFVDKKSKWVKYHAIQGMNLFIVGILYSVLYYFLTSVIKVTQYCSFYGIKYECGTTTPAWLYIPLNIIYVLFFVLVLIGILNVINKKAKELPLINKVKIVKK